MWQPQSSSCCWYCCHQFSNVPAYSPRLDKFGRFTFTGNFCSWNCVKAYHVAYTRDRKPKGHEFVGLFAFLTVHRPTYCPVSPELRHQQNCDCLEKYIPVVPAPDRHELQIFGGKLSIDEFRRGFSHITNYNIISKVFYTNSKINNTPVVKPYLYQICMASPQEVVLPLKLRAKSKQPRSRYFGEIQDQKENDDDEEEEEEVPEPRVYISH